MHFYVETSSDDGFRLVRTHRTWSGKPPEETATSTFEKVEIPDYVSDEPVLFAIELQDSEQPEGKSARMKGGLVLTAEPEIYGDPDAREAAGKKNPVRLRFEEWMPVI